MGEAGKCYYKVSDIPGQMFCKKPCDPTLTFQLCDEHRALVDLLRKERPMVGEKKPQPISEAILDGRKYIVYDRDLADREGDGWVVARWNQGFWVTSTIEPFILENATHFVELRDDVI